jgi:hypothetical protein
MKTLKAIGSLVFQGEVTPKRSRISKRIYLRSLTELEIPEAEESEVVRDAVVATGYDRQVVGLPRLSEAPERSLLGYNGKLFRPMMRRDGNRSRPLRLEEYVNHLTQPPNLGDRIFDPLVWANNPEAVAHDEHNTHLLKTGFFDEQSLEGALHWTDKAASDAIHRRVCSECLLAVGDEIWRRTRPPTWSVAGSDHFPGTRGFVMLETDYSSLQDFRSDKFEAASRLAAARWGESKPLGFLAHADERFLGSDELRYLVLGHSKAVAEKGLYILPYWPQDAVEAYLSICRARRLPDALLEFGAADPLSMLSAIKTLRLHLDPSAVPMHLRDACLAIASEIDALQHRLELDPSLCPALSSNDEEALGGLDLVHAGAPGA